MYASTAQTIAVTRYTNSDQMSLSACTGSIASTSTFKSEQCVSASFYSSDLTSSTASASFVHSFALGGSSSSSSSTGAGSGTGKNQTGAAGDARRPSAGVGAMAVLTGVLAIVRRW